MNKKFYLLYLLLSISGLSLAQITSPCTIYFKSGEVITDMRGTYDKNNFKYYKKVGDRYNKVKFELLDSVTLEEKSGATTRLRFLEIHDEKKIQVVQQVVLGELELYRKLVVKGGYNGASYSYYEYFVKEKDQEILTLIGRDVATKKRKLILYPFLKDCPELITKIDNDESNITRDLSLIINTYNLTCGLKN